MMGKATQTMWVSLEVYWFRILASVRRDMLRSYDGATSEMWFSEDEYNVQNVRWGSVRFDQSHVGVTPCDPKLFLAGNSDN